MPAIPLAKAMIVWTPNREPWTTSNRVAPPGSIAVVHWPDDRGAWKRYPYSDGACGRGWDAGDDYRLQRLAELLEQFLHRDNMNMEHVVEALQAIEGIERLATYLGRSREEEEEDED